MAQNISIWFYLHSIFNVTLLSTGRVILLLEARHLNFPSVWLLSNFPIVSPFLTVPSNVCWYESSITSLSKYQSTSGKGSPITKNNNLFYKFKRFLEESLSTAYILYISRGLRWQSNGYSYHNSIFSSINMRNRSIVIY